MRAVFPHTYEVINRKKHILEMDLKSESDRIRRMLQGADVLIENFRPGRLTKYGLDFDALRQGCPHLVYASIYGYGSATSWAGEPGHDLAYQAFSGMGWVPASLRDEGDRPVKPNFPLSDVGSGLWAAMAILGALRVSEEGAQHIEIAMADVMLHFTDLRAHARMTGLDNSAPWAHLSPTNDLFRTKDGEYIALSLVEDKFWRDLCELLGRSDLAKWESHTSRLQRGKEVLAALDEEFGQRTLLEWETALSSRKLPFAVVQTPDRVKEWTYARERGIFFADEKEQLGVHLPWMRNGRWIGASDSESS